MSSGSLQHLLATPASQPAEQPSQALFQIKSDAADLLAAAKTIVEHVDRAVELKYAHRAQQLRLAAGKDSGQGQRRRALRRRPGSHHRRPPEES